MRYYIGPWQLQTKPFPAWTMPAGAIGVVDLATPAQCAEPSNQANRGIAFFASTGPLPSEYTLVGNGDLRELQVTNAIRSAWRSVAGFRPQGDTVLDCLFEHLTAGADPDGSASCLPLMPNSDSWLDLHLGGHGRVRGERFEWGRPGSRGGDHTNRIRQALRKEFRANWERNQSHARKCLDFLCEKYKLSGQDWRELVPADLLPHVPGRLKHETTITDNFTRADGSTIGNLLTWTEVTGDWATFSNQVYEPTVGSVHHARAESDLSSSDHYAQASVASLSSGSDDLWAGVAARFSSSAATCYVSMFYQFNDNVYLIKYVGGAETILTNTGVTLSIPGTVKTECNGSTIKAYQDGAQRLSITDTAIAGNTRGGLAGYRGGSVNFLLDDFEAADLGGGGGGGILYTQIERGQRGLRRGTFSGGV